MPCQVLEVVFETLKRKRYHLDIVLKSATMNMEPEASRLLRNLDSLVKDSDDERNGQLRKMTKCCCRSRGMEPESKPQTR